MSEDQIITVDDVIACGFCPSGIRRWFHEHRLDFNAFLKNGIPASELLATNDALGIRAVRMTLERRNG